jgi:hypothetical protein
MVAVSSNGGHCCGAPPIRSRLDESPVRRSRCGSRPVNSGDVWGRRRGQADHGLPASPRCRRPRSDWERGQGTHAVIEDHSGDAPPWHGTEAKLREGADRGSGARWGTTAKLWSSRGVPARDGVESLPTHAYTHHRRDSFSSPEGAGVAIERQEHHAQAHVVKAQGAWTGRPWRSSIPPRPEGHSDGVRVGEHRSLHGHQCLRHWSVGRRPARQPGPGS